MRHPARILKKSAVKNIVRFSPIKSNSGKTILVESILESKYCFHLEFDPNVKEYYPQPKTFHLCDEYGENNYTPDFEVHYHSGYKTYVEVKLKTKSSSDHYQNIFKRFESQLINTNAKFLLVDEAEINRQPLICNYERLYQYRKRPSISMDNLYQSAESLNVSSIMLCNLITFLDKKAKLREIYSWLAMGYLKFDMESEVLSLKTEVYFNV